MTSSLTSIRSIEEAIKIGVKKYISKPFSEENVIQSISMVIEGLEPKRKTPENEWQKYLKIAKEKYRSEVSESVLCHLKNIEIKEVKKEKYLGRTSYTITVEFNGKTENFTAFKENNNIGFNVTPFYKKQSYSELMKGKRENLSVFLSMGNYYEQTLTDLVLDYLQ